jgi:hypothetical protein
MAYTRAPSTDGRAIQGSIFPRPLKSETASIETWLRWTAGTYRIQNTTTARHHLRDATHYLLQPDWPVPGKKNAGPLLQREPGKKEIT